MTADTNGTRAPEPLRGRRVVLVDDDEALLRVLATGLEHAGAQVTAFNRFEDAKRHLANATPDILITDVRLGGSNGLHLVVMSKLRDPAMTAVVMTGYDDIVLKKDAEAAGAHYVVKPILASDLVHIVADADPVGRHTDR
jgi:DNA-binding NtrC family response regulator